MEAVIFDCSANGRRIKFAQVQLNRRESVKRIVNPFESVRLAFSALLANRLRSFLTMLGVIIGVGAVIIMIAFIQGAREKAVKDFQSDGSNIVFAAYAPKGKERRGGAFEGMKLADVRAIQERVDTISGIAPQSETGGLSIVGKTQYQTTFTGVDQNYPEVNKIELGSGRYIAQSDVKENLKVCVLGDTVRKKLFGDKVDPLGKEVVAEVNGLRVPFTVIGTLKHKGRGFGTSSDEQMVMPITTLQKRITGNEIIGSFSTRALAVDAETAADQIFTVLKQRYPTRAQDFIVDTQEGLLKRLDALLAVFQLLFGGIGGLSLLVGGIGIMNIMLVSVTERTREIGIRKAVGAKRRDILTQFVVESMTISGVGGMIGVAFGYGASALVSLVKVGDGADSNISTYVPLWAAIMGFTFAVAVGMFFGIYPAVRASKLDPIQALRYE